MSVDATNHFVGRTNYIVGAANLIPGCGPSHRRPGRDPYARRVDDLPERLASKPTFLMNQLATHAHRIASDGFDRAGARAYHYRVLSALAEFGPLSQADLGRMVNMDRSDVAIAVDELAGAGRVERRSDPADRRRRIVHITAAGRRHLARLDRELSAAQDEFLAPLDARARRAFHAALTTLLAHHTAGRHPRG